MSFLYLLSLDSFLGALWCIKGDGSKRKLQSHLESHKSHQQQTSCQLQLSNHPSNYLASCIKLKLSPNQLESPFQLLSILPASLLFGRLFGGRAYDCQLACLPNSLSFNRANKPNRMHKIYSQLNEQLFHHLSCSFFSLMSQSSSSLSLSFFFFRFKLLLLLLLLIFLSLPLDGSLRNFPKNLTLLQLSPRVVTNSQQFELFPRKKNKIPSNKLPP